MEWTTDKPTVPGWYWWRYDRTAGEYAEMCYLSAKDGALYDVDDDGKWYPLVEDGEWYGPLEVPK